jgi:hypothetical protein
MPIDKKGELYGFVPGKSGNPNGRPKGPNKATLQIKEAYINLVNNNLDSIQGWLDTVAQRDPAKAFDMLMKLSPFILPKLSEDVGELPKITFTLPDGPNAKRFIGEQNKNLDIFDEDDGDI